MDALVIITLACFFALFVSALAIARHIRIVAAPPRGTSHPDLWLNSAPPLAEDRHDLVLRQPAEQSLHQVVEHKEPDWRYLTTGGRRTLFPKQPLNHGVRKPPASERLSLRDSSSAPDFEYDQAERTDPYTTASARAAATGTKHR
ncbi:MAG: hypothetical protein NVSMB3_09220 [Acidobacteriaceae bacterium]